MSRTRTRAVHLDRQARYRAGLGNGLGVPGTHRDSPLPRAAAIVGLLVVVGIALGVAHNRLRAAGRLDPAIGTVQSVGAPLQTAAARTGQSAAGGWSAIFNGGALAGENDALRARVDALTLENEQLRHASAENAQLRADLDFVRTEPISPLAARVIAWLPLATSETITIDRGLRSGVRVGMVARTASGLIGRVRDAGPFTAQVQLLVDADSGVGAMVLGKNGRVVSTGIVQGDGRGQPLRIIELSREALIPDGASVVTSGMGGIFGQGIPIGTVHQIHDMPGKLVRSGVITTLAPQPGDLRNVLLLPAASDDGSGESPAGAARPGKKKASAPRLESAVGSAASTDSAAPERNR